MFFHQEIYIRDLNLEFDKLESPGNVHSAQVATATSYKDYCSDQKSLSKLFRKENDKRAISAFKEYHEQGEARKSDHGIYLMYLPDLIYRRTVYQQQQNQKQFLNSIPDRVQVKPVMFVWVLINSQSQDYGTKYWTAVCDVGMVMESFSSYLRYT